MTKTFDGKYDLKLDTLAIINIEKDLKTNPINIFMDDSQIPPLSAMLDVIFNTGKRFNRWTSVNQMYPIFDEYCENGGSITSLVQFIIELFTESGYIVSEEQSAGEEKTDSKN